MKKASPFLISSQFSFIDLFSHYESIPIPETLPSKINNYFSCKSIADLRNASSQTKTFAHPKLIELCGIVKNKNPFLEKGNFSQPIFLSPIQVFTVIDLKRWKFLNFTFTSFITMGILIYPIGSYLNLI